MSLPLLGWLRYLAVFTVATGISAIVGLLAFSTYDSIPCRVPPGTHGVILAACTTGSFGDYDHGAYWFDFEPTATDALRTADVVFLGNSRMQFAFSNSATTNYFKKKNLKPYVLAFGYNEHDLFQLELMLKSNSRPRLYVINADPFFTGAWSDASRPLINYPGISRLLYASKRAILASQGWICTTMSFLCLGRSPVDHTLRSLSDGFLLWEDTYRPGSPMLPMAPPDDPVARTADIARNIVQARQFFARLGIDGRCVVFTGVPNSIVDAPTWARRLGAALQIETILPDVGHLSTPDQSHLAMESAVRWSAVFLSQLDPLLGKCQAPARN